MKAIRGLKGLIYEELHAFNLSKRRLVSRDGI